MANVGGVIVDLPGSAQILVDETTFRIREEEQNGEGAFHTKLNTGNKIFFLYCSKFDYKWNFNTLKYFFQG